MCMCMSQTDKRVREVLNDELNSSQTVVLKTSPTGITEQIRRTHTPVFSDQGPETALNSVTQSKTPHFYPSSCEAPFSFYMT